MGAQNSQDLYALTEENLHIALTLILNLTGLPSHQIQIKRVKVNEIDGEPVYVGTHILGEETKPKMVLVHGFGSSSPLFYNIIHTLTEHFCVIMYDHVGLGCSSRPSDYSKDKSPQEQIEYFVGYFEKWRQQMRYEFLRSGEE